MTAPKLQEDIKGDDGRFSNTATRTGSELPKLPIAAVMFASGMLGREIPMEFSEGTIDTVIVPAII